MFVETLETFSWSTDSLFTGQVGVTSPRKNRWTIVPTWPWNRQNWWIIIFSLSAIAESVIQNFRKSQNLRFMEEILRVEKFQRTCLFKKITYHLSCPNWASSCYISEVTYHKAARDWANDTLWLLGSCRVRRDVSFFTGDFVPLKCRNSQVFRKQHVGPLTVHQIFECSRGFHDL